MLALCKLTAVRSFFQDADGEVLVCQSPCHTAMVYVRRAPVGITRDLEETIPVGQAPHYTDARGLHPGHSGKTDELAAFLGPIFTSEGSIELDRLPAGKECKPRSGPRSRVDSASSLLMAMALHSENNCGPPKRRVEGLLPSTWTPWRLSSCSRRGGHCC